MCEDKVHEVFDYRPGMLKGGISTTPMDAKGPVVVWGRLSKSHRDAKWYLARLEKGCEGHTTKCQPEEWTVAGRRYPKSNLQLPDERLR